jgi:hypothetical protein
MVSKRKAQGAMEYLMTYGWAILVVMIVGIALWQLGIFNFGGTTTSYSGFSKLKPLLAQTELSSGGQMQAVFVNGIGNPITVTGATIEVNGVEKTANTTSQNVRSGDAFLIIFTDAGEDLNPNTPVNAKITITYDINLGGVPLTKTETGTITLPTTGTGGGGSGGETTTTTLEEPTCEVEYFEVEGLKWQQGSSGNMNWSNAIIYCDELEGGACGWYLPSKSQYETLFGTPGWDGYSWQGNLNDWTSTTHGGDPSVAYYAGMDFGVIYGDVKSDGYYRAARCVRPEN